MKPFSLLQGFITATLLNLPSLLFAQNAEWAKLIHGQYTDTPGSLCRDNNDNVYICGRMSSGDVDGHPVGAAGTYDAFLAKFSADGIYQWAVHPGGGFTGGPMNLNEGDGARKVLYDSITNAIYLTGVYEATASGDSARFGPSIAVAGRGAFLAKYDLDGNCIWMRSTSNGGGGSIAIDELGQVYLYVFSDDSYFIQTTTFNGPPSITLPNGQSVAKYTPDGQLLWAKNIGYNIDGKILVRNGHLYFVGGNYGTGSMFMGQSIDENAILGVAFMAAMDSSCTSTEWLQQYPANSNSYLPTAEFTDDGGFILSGAFKDSLFLPMDTLLSSGQESDLVYLRVDSLGQVVWHLTLNSTLRSAPQISQALDGSFNLAFTFIDSFTFNGQHITAANDVDFAVIRVSPDGNLLGLETNGPVSTGRIDVVTLSDGSPVIACPFVGTVDFDNGISLTGGADLFLAKLGLITGIQSMSLPDDGDLLIYANPNRGTCSIELPQALLHEPDLVLRILDAQGRVVQQSPVDVHGGDVHLDIRAHATGIYMAEVGNAKRRYTGRIVFQW